MSANKSCCAEFKTDFVVSKLTIMRVLNEQKRLVVEKLSTHTYSYNTESTDSNLISLTIDTEKFKEIGLKSAFPNDFKILKDYGVK